MLLPGRHANTSDYRYGFNGMENDNELKGTGNSYDFGARMLDPRIGRWFATDPKENEYPSMSPYVAFNNNPTYFIDPDGRNGIASIKKSEGTKKKPHLVKITANFYYTKATETQKEIMNNVKRELGRAKKIKNDGQYYKVEIEVRFIESNDPVQDAKKDVGVNGFRYGNVFEIKNKEGSFEDGQASSDKIEVFDNKVLKNSDQFNEKNREASYQAIFGNVLIEEVLHNMGGLHQDGGAVRPLTKYSVGNRSLTETEQAAHINGFTKDNAAAIFKRIDQPLGTDAKEDPKDKKGNVIEPKLRDEEGTFGQVNTDEIPKSDKKKIK